MGLDTTLSLAMGLILTFISYNDSNHMKPTERPMAAFLYLFDKIQLKYLFAWKNREEKSIVENRQCEQRLNKFMYIMNKVILSFHESTPRGKRF